MEISPIPFVSSWMIWNCLDDGALCASRVLSRMDDIRISRYGGKEIVLFDDYFVV